jgi:hypothetical protein
MAIVLADQVRVIAPAAAIDQETATAPVALVTEIVPGVPAKAIAQAVPERATDRADLATTIAPADPATMAG